MAHPGLALLSVLGKLLQASALATSVCDLERRLSRADRAEKAVLCVQMEGSILQNLRKLVTS